MCGLVAVVAKWTNGFDKPTLDAFHNLLYIDALRGEDSTGVFLVDNTGEVEIIKEASTSSKFQEHKFYDEVMTTAYRKGAFLVGHNRKATKGTINDDNAHPFVVDDKVVLVHNGTLWGDHKKLADTDVDSHAIAHVLSENSNDVQAAISQVQGAYALMWYNAETESMHFLRNNQRPLFFVETQSAWLWSSEEEMLQFVLARNKITPKDKIQQLAENNMCIMRRPNGGALTIEQIEVKPYVYEVPVTNGAWKADWYNPRQIEDVSCELPSTRYAREDTPPATPQVARYSKSYFYEEGLAAQYGCGLSKSKFPAIEEAYRGGLEKIVCIRDYTYVNDKDSTNGYFVYGFLEEDPGLFVRVHMYAHTPEIDILDWTVNEKYATVKLTTGAWRAWSENTPQNTSSGYVIFYGQNFKLLTQEETDALNNVIESESYLA